MSAASGVAAREVVLTRRGLRLAWFTIGYNVAEGVVAVTSGAMAGLVSLVGFGIELIRGNHVATATVERSEAGEAFLSRLPLTVQLRDSFGLALVGELSPALAIEGAAASCGSGVGEIGYSPTDRALAIFYSAAASRLTTPGVVRLGVVTDGLASISGDGQVSVRRFG